MDMEISPGDTCLPSVLVFLDGLLLALGVSCLPLMD